MRESIDCFLRAALVQKHQTKSPRSETSILLQGLLVPPRVVPTVSETVHFLFYNGTK